MRRYHRCGHGGRHRASDFDSYCEHRKGHLVNSPITRRAFLSNTVLGAGALAMGAPSVLRAQSLNENLDVAVIGCGGRGGSNLVESPAWRAPIPAPCGPNPRKP